MPNVINPQALADGLRSDFDDMYDVARNRVADSRVSDLMEMSIDMDNSEHTFAYYEQSPHLGYWPLGQTIPEEGFGAVDFTASVHPFAMRVKWNKYHRKDDQLGGLVEKARRTGESAGRLPEDFCFDLIKGTANTLPWIPLAPDGAALFSTTNGSGADRFGATNGNLLTGTGVATTNAIKSDYYRAIAQFKRFEDGKGKRLLNDSIVDGGALILFSSDNQEVFDETFVQRRQGMVMGTDAGTTPTNVILDSSRNVKLWGTHHLTGNDWYIVLLGAPKKPLFHTDREGVQEFTSFEGDNNGDHTRDTREEYIQFETRQGAGSREPMAIMKMNN